MQAKRDWHLVVESDLDWKTSLEASWKCLQLSPIRFQAQSHSLGGHEVAALPSASLDWEDPAGKGISLAGEGAGEVVLSVGTV